VGVSGNDGAYQSWGIFVMQSSNRPKETTMEPKNGLDRLRSDVRARGGQSKFFQPCSLHFFTNRLTSCERARVVTIKVSGMSTTMMSSTPNKVTRRPDPGTMIPPATCSVRTAI